MSINVPHARKKDEKKSKRMWQEVTHASLPEVTRKAASMLEDWCNLLNKINAQ